MFLVFGFFSPPKKNTTLPENKMNKTKHQTKQQNMELFQDPSISPYKIIISQPLTSLSFRISMDFDCAVCGLSLMNED